MTDTDEKRDVVYQNAPLVEVICELRWRLNPLFGGNEAAAIDPHLDQYIQDFVAKSDEQGFNHVEKIVPDQVPREFLGHKVLLRCRKASGEWPLFQAGPGLFAANHTPPYDGWQSFRPTVRQGLDILFASYPLAEKYIKLEMVELRYIDAFTEKHGLADPAEFIRQELHFGAKPDVGPLMDPSTNGLIQVGTQTFDAAKPAGSKAILRVDSGKQGDEPAVIATFTLRDSSPQLEVNADNVMEWFDNAQDTMHDWFDLVASPELKEKMGPVREV